MSSHPLNDTIFALSTARGRAGVAIIRLSGPDCDAALQHLLGAQRLPAFRQAGLRRLSDPVSRETIDEALILRFQAGASFTGEACAEIQCHGGPAVIAALTGVLSELTQFREAEPGEFTRRAFDNGRLDLVQVEGLADLIHAETEAQRRAAIRHYDGELGRRVRGWSRSLTESLALLEATIDFADEEIPDGTYARATQIALGVREALNNAQSHANHAERLRSGWRVALIGAPNAGKSTLLNALAQRDIAIVSDVAGTTRDALEVHLDIGGYPVTLVDTAGMHDTLDTIEAIGVERARAEAQNADLRIGLIAPDAPLTEVAESLLADGDLKVWNKTDKANPAASVDLAVAAKDNIGLGMLVEAISTRLAFHDPSDGVLLLRNSHSAALKTTFGHLDEFAMLASRHDSPLQQHPELAAEYLRLAREALGEITGETGVERLLDVIFAEFCLGK